MGHDNGGAIRYDEEPAAANLTDIVIHVLMDKPAHELAQVSPKVLQHWINSMAREIRQLRRGLDPRLSDEREC